MTTSTSNALSAADYLKFAQVQMAAEAFFQFDPTGSSPLTPGQITSYPTILPEYLTTGNAHTSKFTPTEATDFAAKWSVVEHISNTATGFSGTLLKNKETGELVMSLRSTEFLDDAARDNEETNKLEIADHGWAFGQPGRLMGWTPPP